MKLDQHTGMGIAARAAITDSHPRPAERDPGRQPDGSRAPAPRIPSFPESVPLTEQTYGVLIEEISPSEVPTSELSYLTLCCWHGAGDVRLSRCGGDLLIFLDEPRGEVVVVTGPEHRRLSPDLHELSRTHRFRRIPPRSAVRIAHDPSARLLLARDECDYVFDARLLATYQGPQLRGKRKLASRFERNHTPTLEILPLSSPRAHHLIAETIDRWLEKKLDSPYLDSFLLEREGVARFPRSGDLADRCLVFTVSTDDGPVALSVVEEMWNDTWTGVILKTDPRLQGATEFTRRRVTSHLVEAEGARWLNIQQDTGAPGLREAKLAYRPSRLEPKYTLETTGGPRC